MKLIAGLPNYTLHTNINNKTYYSLDKGQTYHLFTTHKEQIKRFKQLQKQSIIVSKYCKKCSFRNNYKKCCKIGHTQDIKIHCDCFSKKPLLKITPHYNGLFWVHTKIPAKHQKLHLCKLT